MTDTINDDTFFKAIGRWYTTAPIELLLDLKALNAHMISEHGIDWFPTLIHTGIDGPGMSGPTKIVDEKKYLMFLLRFS
jgi:hypothetical protein